jgi:hypothetical protein
VTEKWNWYNNCKTGASYKVFISSGLWAFGQRQESLGQFAINKMHNCTCGICIFDFIAGFE